MPRFIDYDYSQMVMLPIALGKGVRFDKRRFSLILP